MLANDIHQNPGPPFHNGFFTFMSWNANSIAKDDFQRVGTPFLTMTLYPYVKLA